MSDSRLFFLFYYHKRHLSPRYRNYNPVSTVHIKAGKSRMCATAGSDTPMVSSQSLLSAFQLVIFIPCSYFIPLFAIPPIHNISDATQPQMTCSLSLCRSFCMFSFQFLSQSSVHLFLSMSSVRVCGVRGFTQTPTQPMWRNFTVAGEKVKSQAVRSFADICLGCTFSSVTVRFLDLI